MTAAVRELGLSGYFNTSYPRGLAALIGEEPARYAVIDVGTNSVKFHIGERRVDGTWRAISDHAEMTRLGEGLAAHGWIAPEALDRTAGLRVARNSDDVLAAIRTRAGVAVEVISGEEEGRLAYLAVQAGLGLGGGPLVVFDTGGGSSQFTASAASRA